MGDLKVSNAASIQAAPAAEAKPAKAEGVISKHLNYLKNAIFGDSGKAALAAAASGALIGGLAGAGLPGAVVGGLAGGVVGLGIAAGVKAAKEGKPGLSMVNGALAGAAAAVVFPPVGALLVGGAAIAFATGAAQKAAGKVGEFLGLHHDKKQPEPAPAQ